MYNKSISKIDIVQNIAKELPVPPVMSYFLCDCRYISEKIIHAFAAKGFHTIGALKTNRMLYPFGIKKKLREFTALISVSRSDFNLVTVKNQNYYIYRYEGKLNGIENAVVLLSYPEKAFGRWHITSVLLEQVYHALLKKDTIISVTSFIEKNIYICFNVQKQVMILNHL